MPRIREFLIEEKTRHGRTRYLFHRRPDGRRITVRGVPGEIEFETKYQWLSQGGDLQLDLERAANERRLNGSAPVTLADLAVHYRRFVDNEQDRRAMSIHTIRCYRRFTERFFDQFGSATLSDIETHHLERILDEWSSTDNAWNNALRAIKHLFKYAKSKWGLKPNPAEEIEKRKVVSEGFEPWEPEDISRFFEKHTLGSKAHLAMMLFIEIAPRRADIVRLGPKNIVRIRGETYIKFWPQKTQRTNPIPVSIPLSPELEEAIKATKTGEETFLITDFGNPFSAEGFGNKMAEWRDAAGVRSTVSAHGIRKSVGIDLAENEATPYEIMAALGHSSPKVTLVYTEAADRRRLSSQASAKTTLGKLANPKNEI